MKLGFVGVGNMGAPMCENLIRSDHPVLVHDLNAEAVDRMTALGADAGESLANLAKNTEVIFTSLPGPEDVEKVLLGPDGLASHCSEGQVVVDLSTNAPSTIRRLAAALAERGITLLDAPVSGGLKGAREATLAIMVGGDRAAFDRVEPVLALMGKNVRHMGGPGTGCVTKLVNNMMNFCNQAAAYEGFMMGTLAGVEPRALLDMVQSSTGDSQILTRLERKVLTGNFDAEFTLLLAQKDLRLALQLGDELGTPLMMGGMVINLMRQAVAKGLGEEDVATMVKVIEQAMGREIRG